MSEKIAPIIAVDTFGRTSFSDPLSLDPSRAPNVQVSVSDPREVTSAVDTDSVDPAFIALISSRSAAPKAAQAAAEFLLQRFGPFTSSNTEARRRAILNHLTWLASESGIHYDHARIAEEREPSTHSPNQTVSNQSGVCRDTHVAIGAILASMMFPEVTPDGFKPGSPMGHDDAIIPVGFHNPDEGHALLVFRDPETGRFDTLEYGRWHHLQAADANSALTTLVGHTQGVWRYSLRGWDEGPRISSHQITGAAVVKDFFTRNPGRGAPSQVGFQASGQIIDASLHLNEAFSVSGRVEADSIQTKLRGGVMFHYNSDDAEAADGSSAKLHVAAGAYRTAFKASEFTGLRSASRRADYEQWILGVRADGTTKTRRYALLGEHLQFQAMGQADFMLGLPLAQPKDEASGTVNGSTGDYSTAALAGKLVLSGKETLGATSSFDWSAWVDGKFDLIHAGTELVASGARGELSARYSLLEQPWTAGARAGVDVNAPARLRFELGGHTRLVSDSDALTSAQARVYAAVRVASSDDTLQLTGMAVGGVGALSDPTTRTTKGAAAIGLDRVSLSAKVKLSSAVTLGVDAAAAPHDISHTLQVGVRVGGSW